jgi:hypothetical protein
MTYRRGFVLGLVALAAGACGMPARAATVSYVYHVGNSLTSQTVNAALSMSTYAGMRGINVGWGFHIRCGAGLSYMAANPEDVCVGPSGYGNYTAGLTGNPWDAVTLQTYGDTIEANKTAIRHFVDLARTNPANAATRFYIFEGWGQNLALNGTTYSPNYVSTYDESNPVTVRTWSRSYSNQLMSQLGSETYAAPVDFRRIPTGEVFYQLDQLALAGQLGTVQTIEEWYGDANHMTPLGEYVSDLTMMSAMYGQSPIGLPGPDGMTPEVAAAVQQTVWNVVTSDPYTGVAAAVPEPGGLALLGLGAAAGAILRRRSRAAR